MTSGEAEPPGVGMIVRLGGHFERRRGAGEGGEGGKNGRAEGRVRGEGKQKGKDFPQSGSRKSGVRKDERSGISRKRDPGGGGGGGGGAGARPGPATPRRRRRVRGRRPFHSGPRAG